MTTIELIDHMIEQDGGALFRRHLKDRIYALTDAFNTEEDKGGRGHLGASMLGDPCARKLWIGFRCAQKSTFSGRIQRLFNRGHLEEARFEALLLMIGCEVWTHGADGKQFRFQDIGGHFGGSLDSVIRGIPEMPREPVLAEYKTHSEKSFTRLSNKGLYAAHEKHFVQMQVYMHYNALQHGLYLAVNKNTDALYAEIVPYRKELALQHIDRARSIILSQHIPAKLNESPGWWQCRVCDLTKMCFEGMRPAITRRCCRNCTFAETTEQGWQCRAGFAPVATDSTSLCDSWRVHPDLG